MRCIKFGFFCGIVVVVLFLFGDVCLGSEDVLFVGSEDLVGFVVVV